MPGGVVLSALKPTDEHVKKVRRLASKYFFTNLKHSEVDEKGAICTLYNEDVIMHALKDRLSVGVFGDPQHLLGYLIMLKYATFEDAFGVSMQYELSDYDVGIRSDSAYLLQTCIDDSARHIGIYSRMVDQSTFLCSLEGISCVYAEILTQNLHSQYIHEYLGWYMLSEIPPYPLLSIRGIDVQQMIALGTTNEHLLAWKLFFKELR